LLCRHFDVVNLALRSRNRHTVFSHAFEMKLDGLADFGFNFFQGGASGYAAEKIRDIGGVAVLGFSITIAYRIGHLTS
jgi:hypothetical protein